MTEVIINSKSIISAEGVHTTKGCKQVVCITDRRTFTSVLDAAAAYGASAGDVSRCCNEKRRRITVKGKRFCFLKDIAMHLDDIFTTDREVVEKANAYDALMAAERAAREAEEARQNKIKELEDTIPKLEAKAEKLRVEMNNTAKCLYETKNELTMLKSAATA